MNRQDAQVDRAVRSVIPDCLKPPIPAVPTRVEVTDPRAASELARLIQSGMDVDRTSNGVPDRLQPVEVLNFLTGLKLLASGVLPGVLPEVATSVATSVASGGLDDTVERVEMVGVAEAARLAGVSRTAVQKRIDCATLPIGRDDLGRQRVSRADVLAIDWKRG